MKIDNKKSKNFIEAVLALEKIQMEAINIDMQLQTPFLETLNQLGQGQTGKIKHKPYDFSIAKVNLDSLTKEDVDFFKLVAEKKELTITNINPKEMQATVEFINNNEKIEQKVSYKSIDFSKGLFNLIEQSFKIQKPVRLDFQGDSSVILKVNQEGKLTAEFMSNNAAMEYALKSSLPGLRHKLDSEGIPYEEISYKNSKEQNQNQNNKKKKNKGGY